MEGLVQQQRIFQQAGKYRHKIQIVKPTATQDSTGGTNIRNNTVLLTTWGTVEALSAQEKFAAHEFTSLVTHRIWMRDPRSSMQRVDASMQVWYDGRQFQVEGVLNPNERPDALLLMCIEVSDSKNQITASPAESSL